MPVAVAMLAAVVAGPLAAMASRSAAGPTSPARAGVAWTSSAAPDTGALATGGVPAAAIVRAAPGRLAEAKAAIEAAGGEVGVDLPLVDGFEAVVPSDLLGTTDAASGAIRAVTSDDPVRFESIVYDDTTTASTFTKTASVTQAWSQGHLGQGVGVAVIDTGVSSMADFGGRLVFGPDLSGEGRTVDSYGHGTVMAGLVGGSGADSAGRAGGAYTGVAPKATVVSVKVAGRNGATDVSTVLHGMHWVAAYKDQFNIRVVNISWGTSSKQDPSVDPLNYAVQRLWSLGIVVVVAAGNSGPYAGTITKPADDPVVLTVGAFNDGANTLLSDDSVPSWSSRGPTAQGLSKPDVVAPGRSLIATRSFGSAVEAENPKALVSPSYIKGSGTSQAAAVTSGAAALLLGARPSLTPDQVKAIFTGTAVPISGVDRGPQGAGRVNLAAALTADATAAPPQSLAAAGTGSLESARGGRWVQTDCFEDGTVDVIQGEITYRCEQWNGNSWTGNSWTGNSWTGNSWTGNSWTGNSWTGNSWTDATWSGNSWTGGTWTGNSWTGNSWTGNSWTGNSWTGNSWTGNSWTGNSWTGNSWTTGDYDEFLSAFWGARPHWSMSLPGEVSEARPLGVKAF